PPPPPPDRDLRGGPKAQTTLDAFGPFYATRLLGMLDAAKLKELGIEGSARKLSVKAGGVTYDFVVAPSAMGLSAPYVQSKVDGKVYVLGTDAISALEFAASQLVDKRLH